MSDFKGYSKSKKGKGEDPQSVTDFYNANKNKSEDELLESIFREAAKNKANGTLTNAEIDAFVTMLSPRLNPRQRQKLQRLAAALKQ